jgi:hypothetical protein
MNIVYTNISPITKAYTNLNHVFYLKNEARANKVYLCVWDNFVYENELFHGVKNKQQKLDENVDVLKKLMSHLKMDYNTFTFSEAWDRLFRNSEYSAVFQKILSRITIGDLKKGFELDYIPFDKISISKLSYIIADYLIAMAMPELFPELCSAPPTHYLTSERFKVFYNIISEVLEQSYVKFTPPKVIYVTKIPVIIHPTTGLIPTMEMSKTHISKIIEEHYNQKKPAKLEIEHLLDVLDTALNDKFAYKEEVLTKEELLTKINSNNLFSIITDNFMRYFAVVNKYVQEENVKDKTKTMFIGGAERFEQHIKPLNTLKLKILQNCDGENTSLNIAQKTGMNLSTVSTYLNYLRNQKLIEGDRKPKRLVDNIVIDLKNMGV